MALSKFNTIAAIFLLDYTLPQVTKCSKTLRTKQTDLSKISSIVDAVLASLNDVTTQAGQWVLKLLDSKDDLQQVTEETSSADKIRTFQKKRMGTPFVVHLRENISS